MSNLVAEVSQVICDANIGLVDTYSSDISATQAEYPIYSVYFAEDELAKNGDAISYQMLYRKICVVITSPAVMMEECLARLVNALAKTRIKSAPNPLAYAGGKTETLQNGIQQYVALFVVTVCFQ
jgi:hypothetical protein